MIVTLVIWNIILTLIVFNNRNGIHQLCAAINRNNDKIKERFNKVENKVDALKGDSQ